MARLFSLKDWFEESTLGPSILVLDGGVSTHLEHILSQKNQLFSNRSLWSSSLLLTDEGRQDILETHDTFYRHGADIASSVTYQCHFGTQSTPCPVKPAAVMVQMIHDGLRLAHEAATSTGMNHHVVASMGCYGAALADGSEYNGDYGIISKEHLKDFHRRKLRVVAHGEYSPDAIAFETVPNAMEVVAIIELLQEQRLTIPCWLSLACRNESELNDGTKVTTILKEIQTLDPDSTILAGIGFNCCDSQYIIGLLSKVLSHITLPRAIVLYPNSGEEWDAVSSTWKEGTGCTKSQEFADTMIGAITLIYKQPLIPKLIVGGCCRTSPSTIAALRKSVDEFLRRVSSMPLRCKKD